MMHHVHLDTFEVNNAFLNNFVVRVQRWSDQLPQERQNDGGQTGAKHCFGS